MFRALHGSNPSNEALILDLSGPFGLSGHLVLHQGADEFAYSMHLGALRPGDAVTAKVSPLSANLATPEACIGAAMLTRARRWVH